MSAAGPMPSMGQVAYEAMDRHLPFGIDAMCPAALSAWEVVASEVLRENNRRGGTEPVRTVIESLRAAREWIADRVFDDDEQTLLDEIDQVLEGCGYETGR